MDTNNNNNFSDGRAGHKRSQADVERAESAERKKAEKQRRRERRASDEAERKCAIARLREDYRNAVNAVRSVNLVPFGPENGDLEVAPGFLTSGQTIDLHLFFPFYGGLYNYTTISVNGYLGFATVLDQGPTINVGPDSTDWPRVQDPAMIAPYLCKQQISQDAIPGLRAGVFFRLMMRQSLFGRGVGTNLNVDGTIMQSAFFGQAANQACPSTAGSYVRCDANSDYFLDEMMRWLQVSGRSDLDGGQLATYQAIWLSDQPGRLSYVIINYDKLGFDAADFRANSRSGRCRALFNGGNHTGFVDVDPTQLYKNSPKILAQRSGVPHMVRGRYMFRVDDVVRPGGCSNKTGGTLPPTMDPMRLDIGNIYDWFTNPLPYQVMPISWYPRNFTNPDLNYLDQYVRISDDTLYAVQLGLYVIGYKEFRDDQLKKFRPEHRVLCRLTTYSNRNTFEYRWRPQEERINIYQVEQWYLNDWERMNELYTFRFGYLKLAPMDNPLFQTTTFSAQETNTRAAFVAQKAKEMCHDWYDEDGAQWNFIRDVETNASCPCTEKQAKLDLGRFMPHPRCSQEFRDITCSEMIGAKNCYMSAQNVYGSYTGKADWQSQLSSDMADKVVHQRQHDEDGQHGSQREGQR
uniref:AMOP domain-containing protein n=1 Tax=Globodera pallida TaxID=36090 RepID=A0A183C8H7_GLOPA